MIRLDSSSLALLLFCSPAFAHEPFPGCLPGIAIGGGLPLGYEPSGAVWHEQLGKLFIVSDGGGLASMDADGGNFQGWAVPGDLEAVCVADPQSPMIYIGEENPATVLEYDLTQNVVVRSFDLSTWITNSSNGLEALTFVPDSTHPEGGLFYAGDQQTGDIYVFDLPIQTSATATDVTFVSQSSPTPVFSDITGLDFDRQSGLLYSCYQSSNTIRQMDVGVSITVLHDYVLPVGDHGGIALDPASSSLFAADDNGNQVYRYTAFPIGCPIGTTYCSPAVVNSSGLPAEITATGSEVTADNDLTLTATDLPAGQFGYFLTSQTQASTFPVPGSEGVLCLGGSIGRYNSSVFNSGSNGVGEILLDLSNTPTPTGPVAIQAGETWNFTAWYRDTNPNATSNFTDGVSVTFE